MDVSVTFISSANEIAYNPILFRPYLARSEEHALLDKQTRFYEMLTVNPGIRNTSFQHGGLYFSLDRSCTSATRCVGAKMSLKKALKEASPIIKSI